MVLIKMRMSSSLHPYDDSRVYIVTCSAMARREGWLEIDPLDVYFTHSRVRSCFSGCGRRLEDTLEELRAGRMALEALPVITVLRGAEGGIYFSLNNRRLWVLKELRRAGCIAAVRVRTKDLLPREAAKYSADKCSLSACIMGPGERGTEGVEEPARGADEPGAPAVAVSKAAAATVSAARTKAKALPAAVLKEVKALQAAWVKKKAVAVQSQLDEWIAEGVLSPDQEVAVWALVRG